MTDSRLETSFHAEDAIEEITVARMVAQLTQTAKPVSWQRLGRGIANDVYVVALDDARKLVLRLLKNQTPAGVLREVRVQQALLSAGLVTPPTLSLLSNDFVGYVEGRAFTFSHLVDGSSQCAVTIPLVLNFGRTVARFHRATASLQLDHTDWLSPSFIADECRRLDVDMAEKVGGLLNGTDVLFDADLPEANIHGDLHLENVFVENDEISVIFDLETAEWNVRLLDVAQSALGLSEASEMTPVEAGVHLLEGYDEIESVTSDEQLLLPQALRHVAAASAAWLHLAGDQRLAGHYLQIASGFSR